MTAIEGTEGVTTIVRVREEGSEVSSCGPYPPEVFTAICLRIAEGEPLSRICSEPSMPSRKTFYQWVAEDIDLRAEYENAIALRCDHYADEIISLSDSCREGTKIVKRNGKVETVTADMVERSRLQIDARKWYASKLNPKKYGDRLQADVNVSVETHEQRLQRLTGGGIIDVTP